MATDQEIRKDPLDLSTPSASKRLDRMLDEGIAESFPNSDPVSLAMPHDHIEEKVSRFSQSGFAMRDAWPLLLVGGAILALLLARRG
jgi:hypothetical protein